MTRILVVEDENIVSMDIQNTLKRLGYTIAGVAASGEAAIEKAATTQPDLVLMDIRLKGNVDGIEAAQQIRIRYRIPVIYLTAYADEQTVRRAQTTEPYGYMLKPFEEIELYTNIEMALYKHKMEYRLQSLERWLATTLKSIGDAVITADPDGTITFVNPPAERLIGQQQREVLGRPAATVFTLIDEANRTMLDNPIQQVFEVQETLHLPHHAITHLPGGTETPIVGSIAPIRDVNGTTSGAVFVFHDITERKQAEEQRLAMERRLLEAQKLESLGMMAHGIAHDFNNLLTAIQGNVDLVLLDISSDSPARVSLEQIEVAAHHAASMTRQLLAYAGSGQFAQQPLDLHALIVELVGLLRSSAPAWVRVQLQLGVNLPMINANPIQLRQMIMNLVVNAVEAIGTDAGIVTITTELRYVPRDELARMLISDHLPEGMYLVLEITDTGHGMDATTQARIFEPFFTTKSTGHGLGLAAVLGIVRSHDGALTVESVPGSGTTFRILLPPLADQAQLPPSAPLSAPQSLRGTTVLIVDDNERLRVVAAQMLQRGGWTVQTSTGHECIEVFRSRMNEIACVLLDMTLPQNDSVQILTELRRINRDVRVVLTSGYEEAEAQRYFAGQRLDGFLRKPYTIHELYDVLQQVLGKRA